MLGIDERHIRSYQTCGFTIEELELETAFFDGRLHDNRNMGLLEHELKTVQT